ncbi:MAG: hypothetical protein AMR96_03235 [Candidatus Adiutrix intracellularis]|nr:MAG: hypothetical protein AMR96_03235 [Candidatus Adiutrix intracellularis]
MGLIIFKLKKIILLFLALVLLLMATPLWSGESSGPQPRLLIDGVVFESDNLIPGQVAEHTFVFKNEGDAPLEIMQVKPGCSCSVVSYDHIILPGGTGRITLAITVYQQWAGLQFRRTAWVLTNDPLAPQTCLIIHGLIKTEISSLPEIGPEVKPVV